MAFYNTEYIALNLNQLYHKYFCHIIENLDVMLQNAIIIWQRNFKFKRDGINYHEYIIMGSMYTFNVLVCLWNKYGNVY